MAPESERAKMCTGCGHAPHVGGECKTFVDLPLGTPYCDCQIHTSAPTLTCSEVVERLAAECHSTTEVGAGCLHNMTITACKGFDRAKATAILHSWRDAELLKVVGQDRFHLRKQIEWRERRVQELEEALREIADQRPCDCSGGYCTACIAELVLGRKGE